MSVLFKKMRLEDEAWLALCSPLTFLSPKIYMESERHLYIFFLHHTASHLSSSLWADIHFPLSCLLLHHLCFSSPCCIFLSPQGVSCMQNHCGSLSFKTQSLKIAPFSFHSHFFFFFWGTRRVRAGLIRCVLFLFRNLFCELMVQLLQTGGGIFSVLVSESQFMFGLLRLLNSTSWGLPWAIISSEI